MSTPPPTNALAAAAAAVVVFALWSATAAPWADPAPSARLDATTPTEDGSGAERATFGSVAAPVSQFAGPAPVTCLALAGIEDGVTGTLLRDVQPRARFTLVATDANARAQDLDITFYRATPGCSLGGAAATPAHASIFGDEAGTVPDDAVTAVVFLAAGAAAEFVYREFAALDIDRAAWSALDSLHFDDRRVHAARSTYFDLYEPHIVVAGTGAVYVSGHTAATDSHHSPVFVSTNEGVSWRILPDPEPAPDVTRAVPVIGGRLGQGNEGGITADDLGRAWLYDAAYNAGTTPLYGWCDDGARSCAFDPFVFDAAGLATADCGGDPPRLLDKPWARFGHGKVLLANAGLRSGFVEEYRAASMLGVHDPATGATTWSTCVALGGIPGVPDLRDSDGLIALPHVTRDANGLGRLVVHHGHDVTALATTPPLLPAQKAWQLCNTFNGYGSFNKAGSFFAFAGLDERTVAVAATRDFASWDTLAWDAGGFVRAMWVEGGRLTDGALVTWGAAAGCDGFAHPVSFYAGHVKRTADGLVLRDVSLVAGDLYGVCGHYMGNDVGPDGRAYLVVHASPGGCLGPLPEFAPTFHAPWTLYVQDAGPRV